MDIILLALIAYPAAVYIIKLVITIIRRFRNEK